MMSRAPCWRLCPGRVEPKASERVVRPKPNSAFHCLPSCPIQQDGMSYRDRYDITSLRDVHEQEAWYIQSLL